VAESDLAALQQHLATLPGPRRRRLALAVAGAEEDEGALARRLSEPATAAALVARAGELAPRLLLVLLDAQVPVLRADLAGLVRGGGDALDALEECGLVAALKTGAGMAEHVAITPGLADVLAACVRPAAASAPAALGAARSGQRRRYELALVVAALARVRPRLTRAGQLHQADVQALAALLAPVGRRAERLEAELSALLEDGALAQDAGHLVPVPGTADDPRALRLRRALAELLAPALSERVLPLVAQLLAGRVLLVREVVAQVQAALLRERALSTEALRPKAARAEVLESLGPLLSLASVALLDGAGRAAAPGDHLAVERALSGEAYALALDPDVAAYLQDAPPPAEAPGQGHVQASFEIVADDTCDAAVLARTGLFARLTAADRAAVLRLDERSVAQGAALGLGADAMLAALRALGRHDVPANVERSVRDWAARAPVRAAPDPLLPPAPLAGLRDDVRRRLGLPPLSEAALCRATSDPAAGR
jgi:hypothetical protein